MQYYMKKLAVSGAISATLFALFFYFVYAVENEKYAPKASASEKAYTEETASEVNTIVAQAIEQEVAKSATKIARAPVIQRITAAPASAATPTAPTPSLPFEIPFLSSSAPLTIPSVAPIAIPTAPAPTPAPAPSPRTTIATTPVAPVQPKPAPAPAPRTTVS